MRFGIGGGSRIVRGGVSVGRGGVRGGVGVGPFSVSGGSRGGRRGGGGGGDNSPPFWVFFLLIAGLVAILAVAVAFGLVLGGLLFFVLVYVCLDPAPSRRLPAKFVAWRQSSSKKVQRNAIAGALAVASITIALNIADYFKLPKRDACKWFDKRWDCHYFGALDLTNDFWWIKALHVIGVLGLVAGFVLLASRVLRARRSTGAS